MNTEFRPSYGFVRKRGVAVAGLDAGAVQLAAREPVDLAAVQELRRRLGCAVRLERLSAADFDRLINRLYAGGEDEAQHLADDLADGLDGELDLARLAEALPEPSDLLESEDDAPIIRLINGVLAQALREGASDIHVEPFEQRLSIRFRVDGVLREVMSPARALAALITSRIKVMARLDIAEKRLPQDGRISLRLAGRPVDVRVSTLPASHGERVVMRLLDKQAGPMGLSDLGMAADTEAALSRLIQRPHGILLVTGPTGSGKTTTLYAALQQLNDRSRNIMTIEDPIEYELDGIGQTQVNPRVDLTFARGLRAILRQDPDVVMVGEIRDLETARIAVQASLTGHLVLATLHTNSAVGAVTRLVDMGIEPFLLSSSLIGVVAQRLVRRLDPQTSEAVTLDASTLQSLGVVGLDSLLVRRPRANLASGQSGYQGRMGMYELLTIDSALQQAIHAGAGEHELLRLARQAGPSLLEDGLRLVRNAQTSLEEVLRVTRSA